MIPFHCPHGHVLRFGKRLARFEEYLGDGIMRWRYVDGDEEIVLVSVGRDGALGMPTVAWIVGAFRAGDVVDPQYRADVTDRRQLVLHLDRAACIAIDPKSGWRFDWATAALSAHITKTKEAAGIWIAANDLGGRKPNPVSMLRWMKTLVDHKGLIGSLVSTAGRERGQSQLSDIEDRLVHKWAMLYWRTDELNGQIADKEDAAALAQAEWDVLKEIGVPYLGEEAPSAETMRVRINSLECESTYAARYGRPAADKRFRAAGEPVEVERPFERIFVDGVEWEHSVFYSENEKVPAGKMKSVIAMDAFSQYIFPYPVFVGDYRPVWGLRALRSVMMPPEMSQEDIDADPELALIYGLPSDVMFDRDRSLLPPRSVPGAVKIWSTAELAEAYHSDAKSKLERYHKYAKRCLRRIKGRILGPRLKHDLGYDPIASTALTRQQYADLHEQLRLHWNRTPKRSLGWRSPNDVMRAFLRRGGIRLTDPKEVMRTFASTPRKLCVLTTNGLVYDNVHYRFNQEAVSRALSANHHATPFAKRLAGTVRLEVSIRVWDDDIDMIEVYDEENRAYFPMWSTDPGYTGGLNRWEHHVFQKALRDGKYGATSKRDRLRAKAETLEKRHRTLTGKSFRDRGASVELLNEEERRLSGRRAVNPACAQVPELHVPTRIDGADRDDLPTPPHQGKSDDATDLPEGAADLRSDPSRKIAEEVGDDDALLGTELWKFSDDDDEEEDE